MKPASERGESKNYCFMKEEAGGVSPGPPTFPLPLPALPKYQCHPPLPPYTSSNIAQYGGGGSGPFPTKFPH